MVPAPRPISIEMGVCHSRGIVAQEVLSPFIVGLIRMRRRLVGDDNSLAIYQLAARISSVANITNWERAS
jgi:hypothetical protein